MTGLLILLGIVFIESIMLAISLRKKAYAYSEKRWVRIIFLALILFLLTLNILQIGFRYYALILLLSILILTNDYSICKMMNKPLHYKKSRAVRKSIGVILLFGLVTLPAILFPQYKALGTTGEYLVQTTDLTFTDMDRIELFNNQSDPRKVNMKIWYPSNTQKKHPLIIFSHGAISLPTSNESLYLELASHGYVVFSLGHPYHSLLTKDDFGKRIWIDQGYMKELNIENAKENPQQSYEFYQKWMELRTSDIHFVIDYIKEETKNENNALYEIIDIMNIGVIGHSLGGSAALCIGRNREDVKAIIALESPFMCDITGTNNQGFIFDESAYPTPLLNIYSDSAWNYLSIWPQYAQNYRLLNLQPDDIINYHISGSGHLSLTDLSLTSPIITRLLNGSNSSANARETLRQINIYSLEFLNTYLKSLPDG